jgi:hypothetical protein
MKKALLALMLASSNAHESFAEDQSPMLKAQLSLQQAEELCLQEGHEFRLLANPIVTADLGGAPDPEVIFDYGALICVGDSWMYRGSMGAAVNIYTSTVETGYLSKNGYELVPFEGHWAARFQMSQRFSSANCPVDCWRYVYIDDRAFVEKYRK